MRKEYDFTDERSGNVPADRRLVANDRGISPEGKE